MLNQPNNNMLTKERPIANIFLLLIERKNPKTQKIVTKNNSITRPIVNPPKYIIPIVQKIMKSMNFNTIILLEK